MSTRILQSILLFFALSSIPAAAMAGNDPDPDVKGVEVSCILRDGDARMSGYTIIIYCENMVTDTLYIEKPRQIYFFLPYGHQYAIRHIATGYRDRVVMINTCVDKKTAADDSFFDYDLEMVKEDAPNNTLYDLPVAVVRYDAKLEKFDYSRKYQKQVRQRARYATASN